MKTLINILERSVNNNGNKVLTTQHLLNIIKLAQRIDENQKDELSKKLDEALMQDYADQCGDRD